MTGGRIPLSLAPVEALQLGRLLSDFRDLVGDGRDADDPALERLTPTPYPDDDDAASDFRAGTRRDLLDRRLADAQTVESALSRLRIAAETMSEEDLFTERLFEIDAADLDAWLRTITAIRLVVATRIGIADAGDDEPPQDDERIRVYDWLGYRLETLVHAADRLG